MKKLRLTLPALLFALAISIANADDPRTLIKGTPKISGREVSQLVLLVPISCGRRLPPGLPTYTILPNRFVAASEDKGGVFFQAVARFQAESPFSEGGLYVSKTELEYVAPYIGDARNLRLPLHIHEGLTLAQVRKLKLGRAPATR